MNKELKFSGYTAQPSDYECPDGDLASVLNLIPEKGALRPVPKPTTVLTVSSGTKVVFIHETAFFKHYITYRQSDHVMQWIDASAPSSAHTLDTISSYDSISVIGNILIVFTSTGMRYYKWDADDYKKLGSMPELDMQFGMISTTTTQRLSGTMNLTGSYPKHPTTHFFNFTYPVNLSDSDQDLVTEKLLAQVNKWVADTTQEGYFIMPFFVRYAFRLYDGSTTKASAPILMLPTSKMPCEIWMYDAGNYRINTYKFGMSYLLDNATQIANLKEWSEIITSVDIYISAPIFNYDQSGKCKRLLPQNYYTNQNVGEYGKGLGNGFISCARMRNSLPFQIDEQVSLCAWGEYNTGTPGARSGTAYYELPQFDDEEFMNKFKSVSSFYLYHSIPVSELVTGETAIAAKEDYLVSLVNKETLVDDYDSHDILLAKGGFNYNSRLNLYGISKKKFGGFSTELCNSIVNGFIDPVEMSETYWTSDYEEGRGESTIPRQETRYWTEYNNGVQRYIADCWVHIKTNGEETVVNAYSGREFSRYGIPRWFYYPDTNAYKAVILVKKVEPENWTNRPTNPDRVDVFELPLTPHDYLNGAYYFNGFDAPEPVAHFEWDGQDERDWAELIPDAYGPLEEVNRTIPALSKIYTSDVNNPFSFSVGNINTIGTGEVLALCTAAKALSQGQFGQFPLYAFTTDGVWALEVSSTTGAFSAKQPITRDVCINPDSITQIDSAVLFATDRGIMLISGSQTQCITDVIDNDEEPFIFTALPLSSQIRSMLFSGGETESSQYPAFPERGFTTVYLRACQMLYAYNRQAIIVFNPNYGYCYVYSMESKNWGIIHQNIKSRLNSYPQAYAMLADGRLVDFSQEDTVPAKQFLLTRPLKLDGSLKDIHKTIDTIIVRGKFEKGHVGIVLYGSRDLTNWFPVATSADHYLRGFRGTPYKHFRIALICSLTHDESVWGASVQFTPRLTNQPR